MDTKSQNQFNNPVVIILVVALLGLGAYVIFSQNQNNTQPTQSNQNYQQVTDNSQNTQLSAPEKQSAQENVVKTKSTAEIAKEWGRSIAYLVCDWNYSNGALIQEVSGSGLVAILNSVPTIITNKHVVYNPTLGYTNGCIIKFPNDNGYYMYSHNDPNTNGGYWPDKGVLTIDSNGNDVAYISGIDYAWTSLSLTYPIPTSPQISLSSRSKSGYFSCKNQENWGDPILVLGYPVYGPQMNALGSPAQPTVTEGIISGIDGIYYTTSAKIDHGNSGGLAIDQKNDCYFGIPTWNESGSFESLGRILPASTFLR